MTARLEDLTPGARIRGVLPDRPVTVVQVAWHGSAAVTLTYRDDDGRVGDQLLFRDGEPSLEVEEAGRAWSFDADGMLFRLVSEAHRIRLAYLFDPMLAVSTSNIEPLPHQLTAVYEHMLPRQPLRYLLADDPGAGKTIMAGLFIKELIVRGDVKRCMVVAPGSLVEQWQDELWSKFGLDFDIVTRETIENSKSGNPFGEKHLVIARLDHMARNESIQAKLDQTDWDLIIFDEAHKCAAHYFGNEVKRTKRYQLAERLGRLTRHLLLMTATPHSGSEMDFQLFMALLDADRFEGKVRDGSHAVDSSDMMRRMVKEKLVKFDGRPLFPERRAYSPSFTLSKEEAYLYKEVTDYVREQMGRAEQLSKEGHGRRGNMVGFALTILQRRLASSPEAIYQSILRRKKRLEDRLRDAELQRRGGEVVLDAGGRARDVDFEDLDLDDMPDEELEELEEEVVDQASASRNVEELRAEIAALTDLEEIARKVRGANTDRKWEELRSLLQGAPEMFDSGGGRRKLIIFTEHRDTLNYLEEKISTLLGKPESIVMIHGGMGREQRRKSQELFTQDRDVHILLATDAAGEGINLQRAHLLVNYDLPWNPNRIEQRFGRIHRIGQTEVCHMWNLVAAETREGEVFERLFQKLESMREALGGQVYDVLGEAFTGKSLRELLIEAIRYGDQPDVRARLDLVIDNVVEADLRGLVEERALASDVMTSAHIEKIRENMERAEARRLQPHFIREFFIEAFRHLGGTIVQREPNRYEITHVPADIRNRDRAIGSGAPVLRRYERVTFEKSLIAPVGQPPAEVLSPGHPLLDATADLILERYRELLKKGTILVDQADAGEDYRVLQYLEHGIQDARLIDGDRRRVVSKQLQFVEIDRTDQIHIAGYAPYLDYRPPDEDELSLVTPILDEPWLKTDVEKLGLDYAIQYAVPAHLEEVRRRTIARVDKTIAAVKDRLTKEITYWDHRAEELKQQELAGKNPRMNSGRARQRADELQGRLKRRLEELAQERELSPQPPLVVGGALVIPAGLIERMRGLRSAGPNVYAKEREWTERRAVDTVLATERTLGREPTEMPRNNPGYDVESKDPGTGTLHFIEVKGRVTGADVVTITKTEILTSKNKPGQFILALVEVIDDDNATPKYMRGELAGGESLHFATTSVNYNWKKMFEAAGEPS